MSTSLFIFISEAEPKILKKVPLKEIYIILQLITMVKF